MLHNYKKRMVQKSGWGCRFFWFFFGFCFCSGQDNLGSNHLIKSFLSSKELPKVLEIGRDVSFF